VQPLTGLLVVDLTKYLPGAFAGRELLRLGARVVRVEPPDGDPTRRIAPAWDEALNAGKESVVCDLKAEPELARALLARADVVLEGFRPGVAERLGVGPDAAPTAVYASITGFGDTGRHAQRAGHDLNYVGWAGVLEDTSPSVPPVQVADLSAGAQGAVIEILAALIERSRTGRGTHIVVSMTHGSHRFVSHRLGGEPVPRLLTGGAACYRIYATADGRALTVAALEPQFWRRLCEVVGLPELESRAFEPRLAELEEAFASRPLVDWLALFDAEDVCVGPVATLEEAAAEFSAAVPGVNAPGLGEHTSTWRAELQR
jgi:crotonobetainyl-CoA:carnitine CoA-transferase CaiB-like acyl-CoA transferase